MSRRLVALSATLLGCAACGGDGPRSEWTAPFCAEVMPRVDAFTAQQTALPTAGRGGTVTAAVVSDLEGMNSLTSQSYEARQHQIFVNLMTLVRYNADLEAEPYLAESWTIANDGTELEFVLRDDVFWHDGTPTTARDVAFTFERARDPETGFPNAVFFQPYESVEVVDDRTVRFTTAPQADLVDAWRATAILPEHLLGDVPSAALEAHPFSSQCPVGNGPFRFVSHDDDASWVFEANRSFPPGLGGPPSIDRYVLRIIPDQSTVLNELRSGGIELYPVMRADQASTVESLDGLQVIRFTSLDYSFIAWNTRREVLSDARVRRALTMGLDRQAIVDELVSGFATVANHGVPPALWQFDANAGSNLTYDPAGAAALLTAAGWEDLDGDGVRENRSGTPLRLELLFASGNELRSNIAQLAQAQLGTLGVEVVPQALEGNTMVDRITGAERDFDAVTLSYTAEFAVNDYDLYHSRAGDGQFAWSGVADPSLDAILDSLQRPMARSDATALWARYQRMIANLTPWSYLYFGDRVAGVADSVGGVIMDARGEWVSIQRWTVGER